MPDSLLNKLDLAPLLADGAMGTMLHAHGVAFDRCFDELNLTQPSVVADIHRAYVDAGAQIIETNTFGANRYKLSRHGLETKVRQINAAAVSIARSVADASSAGASSDSPRSEAEWGRSPLFVAGSVGPLGVRLAPFGRVNPEQAYVAFHDQIVQRVDAAVAGKGLTIVVIESK